MMQDCVSVKGEEISSSVYKLLLLPTKDAANGAQQQMVSIEKDAMEDY
jgi:hypothetical protein